MPKKRTAAWMARLVAQWRRSGASGASFARRHQIPVWTFWYWCRKLSAEPLAKAGHTTPTTFVPVRMTADLDTPVMEIVFAGGERLQVRGGASADLLRAAVTALRSAC
ncbi:MAG: hypothetical protein HY657_19985 [Acidobacteria bacterium]|nr:hypothetical protein [Acidobacteriota bacterium]